MIAHQQSVFNPESQAGGWERKIGMRQRSGHQGRWMDQDLGGSGIGDSRAAIILPHFINFLQLPESTQTCTSYIVGAGPS